MAEYVFDPVPVTAASLILAATLLFYGRRKEALVTTITVAGTLLVTSALKLWLALPRPPDALISKDGGSLPSGHVALISALVLSLLYVYWSSWGKAARGAAAALTAALIGFVAWSRLALHLHYLTDVAAAFLLAFLFFFLAVCFAKRRL